jgi:hypothetical protein
MPVVEVVDTTETTLAPPFTTSHLAPPVMAGKVVVETEVSQRPTMQLKQYLVATVLKTLVVEVVVPARPAPSSPWAVPVVLEL